METYCVSCKKNTENENSSVRNTKKNRLNVFINLCYLRQEKIDFY